MAGCCVLPLRCGGSVVSFTLRSCTGDFDGSYDTPMFKMDANLFNDAVCFYPSYGMWLGHGGPL